MSQKRDAASTEHSADCEFVLELQQQGSRAALEGENPTELASMLAERATVHFGEEIRFVGPGSEADAASSALQLVVADAQCGSLVHQSSDGDSSFDQVWLERIASVISATVSAANARRAQLHEMERFGVLEEGSRLGIWEWNPRTGENLMSQKGCEILGYSKEELANISRGSLAPLIHPDDRAGVEEAMARHILGETDFFEAEMRMKSGSDAWVWILDRGRVVERDQNGNPVLLIGTIEDISHRWRHQEVVERLQRLESIGISAGGVAHDFNNMLVGLQGGVSLAMEACEPDSEIESSLELALDSLDRAKALTKQLLTLARGGEPNRESIDLMNLIERTAQFDLAGSAVRCDIAADGEIWPVYADRGQIQQVFSNLLINARNALKERGRVMIRLRNVKKTGEGQNRWVRAVFEDEGPGIPDEIRSRIFEPYFTTKREGTGLGLATSRSIVERHGGKLTLIDDGLKGATFELLLPVAKEKPSAIRRLLRREFEDSTVISTCVLVVDDEPTVREVAKCILERFGHEVVVAESAEDGIAAYENAMATGNRFDVVLMDITLPGGMSGKDAVAKILERDEFALVIASTGYSEDRALKDPGHFGFAGTLEKPYDYRALTAVVRDVLAPADGTEELGHEK